MKYLNCHAWHNLMGCFRKQNIKHEIITGSSFGPRTRRTRTCMWSPAKTIRVLLVANARGMMVSHSMAWAASSNRMCVKNPTKYSINTIKQITAAIKAAVVLFFSAKERVQCADFGGRGTFKPILNLESRQFKSLFKEQRWQEITTLPDNRYEMVSDAKGPKINSWQTMYKKDV